MNNRKRIWHKIFRYVSSFFLGFWIYETVEEGWAGNGKWLITEEMMQTKVQTFLRYAEKN